MAKQREIEEPAEPNSHGLAQTGSGAEQARRAQVACFSGKTWIPPLLSHVRSDCSDHEKKQGAIWKTAVKQNNQGKGSKSLGGRGEVEGERSGCTVNNCCATCFFSYLFALQSLSSVFRSQRSAAASPPSPRSVSACLSFPQHPPPPHPRPLRRVAQLYLFMHASVYSMNILIRCSGWEPFLLWGAWIYIHDHGCTFLGA